MSTTIDVPTDWERFPRRCVNCGASPDTTVTVDCSTGVDLVFVKFSRWHEFSLPVCSSCKTRRRGAGVLCAVLSIVAVFGSLLGMFALEPIFKSWGQRDVWLLLTLGVFLAVLYFVRNWVSPVLDARLLGVRGVRLTKQGMGSLRFRDDEFGAEAAALVQEDQGTAS